MTRHGPLMDPAITLQYPQNGPLYICADIIVWDLEELQIKKKCVKAPDHSRGKTSDITLPFLTLQKDCLLSIHILIYKCCCLIYVFLKLCFTLTSGIKCFMLVSIIRANSALMENYL